MISEVAAIIGAAAGLLSLAGVVYIAGYWKGTVDASLRELSACNTQYPPADTARMVKTMWDIYVVEALQKRPDLADHSSPWHLTKNAEILIPAGLKQSLERIEVPLNRVEDLATGWLVVQALGIDTITAFAQDANLSLQEAVAILSTHLDGRRRGCGSPNLR